MRIKISKRQKASFILAALLLVLNFAMRQGIWKRMQNFNLEKTRYEKLALAHHLKGQEGIDYELAAIGRHDPSAADFVTKTTSQLKEAKDAGTYLKASMAKDREEINLLKTRRFWISCVIFAVLASQAFLNIFCWFKDNRHKVP